MMGSIHITKQFGHEVAAEELLFEDRQLRPQQVEPSSATDVLNCFLLFSWLLEGLFACDELCLLCQEGKLKIWWRKNKWTDPIEP